MMRQRKQRPTTSVKMAQDFKDIRSEILTFVISELKNKMQTPFLSTIVLFKKQNNNTLNWIWQYFIHVKICMKIRRISYDMTDVVEA